MAQQNILNQNWTCNKLLTYSSLKAFYGKEPYVALVNNRNQRCHLSRLRVSAHRLGIEVQRYKRPFVPRDEHFCAYCPAVPGPGGQAPARPVDDELHCITECVVGQVERLVIVLAAETVNLLRAVIWKNLKCLSVRQIPPIQK